MENDISLDCLPQEWKFPLIFYLFYFDGFPVMGTVMSTATVPQCAPGFHTMGGDEAMRQYDICRGETLECMNNILNRMGQ